MWEHDVDMLATSQKTDLVITRQWLRTLTWQIAVSNLLLSSEAGQSDGLWLYMPLQLSNSASRPCRTLTSSVFVHCWRCRNKACIVKQYRTNSAPVSETSGERMRTHPLIERSYHREWR